MKHSNHPEILIKQAQDREDARADAEGRKPRLIATLSDIHDRALCVEQPLPFGAPAVCQTVIREFIPRRLDDGTEIRFTVVLQGTENVFGTNHATLHGARQWAWAARRGMLAMGARNIAYVEELFEDTLEAEAARDARE